ncbi:hypothetical protein ACFVVA_19945 [Kitasatospora sp. NPDC058048]|uniref:hypothetical protein n=1 Tax=Kitasatospora sp. NPDC058048 TaxID=3346313 RepID=UPI0036D75D0F
MGGKQIGAGLQEPAPLPERAFRDAGNLGTARVAHLVARDTTAERCLQHLADATRHLDITVD